jgi:hypothetical protein
VMTLPWSQRLTEIGVEITYMNGESESFSGSELSKIMAGSIRNSCAVQ